jgi:hypothetical protein
VASDSSTFALRIALLEAEELDGRPFRWRWVAASRQSGQKDDAWKADGEA